MGEAAKVRTKRQNDKTDLHNTASSFALWIQDEKWYMTERVVTSDNTPTQFLELDSKPPPLASRSHPPHLPVSPCGRAKAAEPSRPDTEPPSNPRSWPPQSGWAQPERRWPWSPLRPEPQVLWLARKGWGGGTCRRVHRPCGRTRKGGRVPAAAQPCQGPAAALLARPSLPPGLCVSGRSSSGQPGGGTHTRGIWNQYRERRWFALRGRM